jgi:hypothetical protein
VDSRFGDDWFPAKAKIVADFHIDEEHGNIFLRFTVDPKRPNRWRDEPYYSTIKRLALAGLRGELLPGNKQCSTIVAIKGNWTLVLPHKEIPYQRGIVLRVSDDQFELLPCNTDEKLARVSEVLNVLERAARRTRQAYPEIARQNPFALLDVVAQDPEIVALMAKHGRRT